MVLGGCKRKCGLRVIRREVDNSDSSSPWLLDLSCPVSTSSVSFANKYFIFYWIFYEAMKTNKKATALLCIVNKLTWLG